MLLVENHPRARSAESGDTGRSPRVCIQTEATTPTLARLGNATLICCPCRYLRGQSLIGEKDQPQATRIALFNWVQRSINFIIRESTDSGRAPADSPGPVGFFPGISQRPHSRRQQLVHALDRADASSRCNTRPNCCKVSVGKLASLNSLPGFGPLDAADHALDGPALAYLFKLMPLGFGSIVNVVADGFQKCDVLGRRRGQPIQSSPLPALPPIHPRTRTGHRLAATSQLRR